MDFVKLEKAIKGTHPTLGKLELDGVEVVQYASTEEFIKHAGGEEAATDWLNGVVKTAATNNGRMAIRGIEVWDDEAKTKVRSVIKDWSPNAAGRELGKAKKAEKFDSVAEMLKNAPAGKTFSLEEMAEMLGVKLPAAA
jgi:hypothetical protein